MNLDAALHLSGRLTLDFFASKDTDIWNNVKHLTYLKSHCQRLSLHLSSDIVLLPNLYHCDVGFYPQQCAIIVANSVIPIVATSKMKCQWLLCLLAYAPAALANEPPQTTQAPELIEARAEMTYWQNWAVGGGAILTGVSALAGSAAAIISAMSSKSSCATTIYILQNPKRSDEVTAVEGVSTELAGHGFAPYGEWYHHDNGTKTFEGFFTDGVVRMENIYVSGNYTGGRISMEKGGPTGLEKRTWAHNKVEFVYHSHAGVCTTRLSRTQLHRGIEAQLTKMANNRLKCACWTYTGGGGWYGEVKFMEVDTQDVPDGWCFNKVCNAT